MYIEGKLEFYSWLEKKKKIKKNSQPLHKKL
jgi:hypothetical protein